MSDVAIAVLAILALFAGLMFLGNAASREECRAKWQDSSFQYRYSLFGGCQISADGKVWLPSENYREIAE